MPMHGAQEPRIWPDLEEIRRLALMAEEWREELAYRQAVPGCAAAEQSIRENSAVNAELPNLQRILGYAAAEQ